MTTNNIIGRPVAYLTDEERVPVGTVAAIVGPVADRGAVSRYAALLLILTEDGELCAESSSDVRLLPAPTASKTARSRAKE